MTVLTGTRIASQDGYAGNVVKPSEGATAISLFPLKVKTIMLGVLFGEIAGIVGSILYAVMR
jgi:hypothetical protein